MEFGISWGNLINVMFISAGVGICGMSLMQVSAGMHINKDIKRYFQVFFSFIIIYITMHLT